MRQYPEKVSCLRQLIDSGRCELSGGLYVQPDENLVHGESLIRQVFYGQKWLVETLGRKAKALGGWDIDSFGHSMHCVGDKIGRQRQDNDETINESRGDKPSGRYNPSTE